MLDLKSQFPKSNILCQIMAKRTSKKGKAYLCITNDVDNIKCINIHFIQYEKDNVKAKQFPLKELSVIDAQDFQNEPCLTLHFEKPYKWILDSYSDKLEFIKCLFMLTNSMDESPTFSNADSIISEILNSSTTAKRISEKSEQKQIFENSELIDGLTDLQNEDLLKLFSNFDEDIINAESFLEKITKDASSLDSANCREILNSQEAIKNLLNKIDNCICEIEEFDHYLYKYSESIEKLCRRIQKKQKADYDLQLSYNNKQRLYDFLNDFINKLSLSPEHVNALIEDKLRSALGIEKCVLATKALQECLSLDIPESLRSIQAVEEQMTVLIKNKNIFTKRFFVRMNSIFQEQASEMENKINEKQYLLSDVHLMRHSELLNYGELILWIKYSDPTIFKDIIQIYVKTMRPIYQGQVKNLIEFITNSILGLLLGSSLLHTSQTSNSNLPIRNRLSTTPNDTLVTINQQTSVNFNETFEKFMSILEPICFCELNFCCHFFDGMEDVQISDNKDLEKVVDGIRSNFDSLSMNNTEYTRKLMTELFSDLGQQFSLLVDFTGKYSIGLSLNIFVILSTRMLQYSKSVSDLLGLPKILIIAKRLFDQFIEDKIRSYKEYKLSKKKSIGIVPHIADLYAFVGMANSLMNSYSVRNEVLKAFNRLVENVFEFIEQTAIEQPKTTRQHLIRLENYHRLLDVLKKLKVKNLEAEVKEAKSRYDNSRSAYIEELMGFPLLKLNEFMKAICARVDVGVKMADISYELAFSKREARKLIKEYHSKKVFESLDNVYHKVERQISKDTNLLPVIWSFVREEFVRQFHSLNNLLKECYSDSSIALQFSIDDVTKFFDTFF